MAWGHYEVSNSFVEGQFSDAEVENEDETDVQLEAQVEAAMFNPPLYKQRYERVAKILREKRIKSVVDFGCAECFFIKYLKNINPELEKIIGVDIDGALLRDKRFLTMPLTCEYLKKRSRPLTMSLHCGSVTDYDPCLMNIQAVTMIELIEHLFDDVLDELPHNIFHNVEPDIVLVTTPNCEYNVLFKNFTGVRHADHKFEWTREQFQTWGNKIVSSYPAYTVTFDGIGAPPGDRTDVGHCSQMAVFERTEPLKSRSEKTLTNTSQDTRQNYIKICETEHPYENTGNNLEDKIIQESEYYLHSLARSMITNGDLKELNESGESSDNDRCVPNEVFIKLNQLFGFPQIKALCTDIDQLRSLLTQHGYTFTSDDKIELNIDGWWSDSYTESDDSDVIEDNQPIISNAVQTVEESWDEEIDTGNVNDENMKAQVNESLENKTSDAFEIPPATFSNTTEGYDGNSVMLKNDGFCENCTHSIDTETAHIDGASTNKKCSSCTVSEQNILCEFLGQFSDAEEDQT